ncbi:MAG: hypothetical protein LBB54_04435 [Cellulomonadaceae bacterium]|jgi:hypothetical protein|nr:hypothetical protein [Cellulomonadaceae bacterium]
MLRLTEQAQVALDRVMEAESVTQNAAINQAIIEYDARRASVRDALLKQIISDYQPLLDRLAQ